MKLITYNAGKFYYDGNKIVNTDLLKKHSGLQYGTGAPLEDGQQIPFPATLRAEVENYGVCCCPLPPNINHWNDCNKCEGYTERKVVRLVEVESKYRDQSEFETEEEYFNHCRIARSTGILAVGLPQTDDDLPAMGDFNRFKDSKLFKDKQAIGEMVRPIEELFMEEYYGLKTWHENDKLPTNCGDVVNLLTMFKDKYLSKAFVAGRSKQSWESFQNEIGESSQPPPQAESQLPTEKIDELIRV